ncbi:hypothetical protein K438DRAFT_1931020 [Mycena galopus ATCC 62051]|nr:hypothetical protein K438DRAFT_1931020 [Mycena galopus ATCC 62051]
MGILVFDDCLMWRSIRRRSERDTFENGLRDEIGFESRNRRRGGLLGLHQKCRHWRWSPESDDPRGSLAALFNLLVLGWSLVVADAKARNPANILLVVFALDSSAVFDEDVAATNIRRSVITATAMEKSVIEKKARAREKIEAEVAATKVLHILFIESSNKSHARAVHTPAVNPDDENSKADMDNGGLSGGSSKMVVVRKREECDKNCQPPVAYRLTIVVSHLGTLRNSHGCNRVGDKPRVKMGGPDSSEHS